MQSQRAAAVVLSLADSAAALNRQVVLALRNPLQEDLSLEVFQHQSHHREVLVTQALVPVVNHLEALAAQVHLNLPREDLNLEASVHQRHSQAVQILKIQLPREAVQIILHPLQTTILVEQKEVFYQYLSLFHGEQAGVTAPPLEVTIAALVM